MIHLCAATGCSASVGITQLSTQYSVLPSGTRKTISRSFFASATIARRMSAFQPMPKSISPREHRSMNVELIVSTFGLTSTSSCLASSTSFSSSLLIE